MTEYLNLPTGEQHERIATALEAMAKTRPQDDYTNSPGSKYIIAGDKEAGFYGFVQPDEFGEIVGNTSGKTAMTGDNLALAIGLTQGTATNINTPWMKLSSKGKVIFVPVKPLRHSVSWDAIYKQGAVFGDDSENKSTPNSRSGSLISINGNNNSIVVSGNNNWNETGGVIASAGEKIILSGFKTASNNGEFTVKTVGEKELVVEETLSTEPEGNYNAQVMKKGTGVKQDRKVTIGENIYRVRLLKGGKENPSRSREADRGAIGSEWNKLIIPMHVESKLKTWAHKAYIGDSEYWGADLTNGDLVTLPSFGGGYANWMQEVADGTSFRRIYRGTEGIGYVDWNASWSSYWGYGWRPVLELQS